MPSRDFVFVGYHYHRYLTTRGLVMPSEDRTLKIMKLLSNFLLGHPLQAIMWQSMRGLPSGRPVRNKVEQEAPGACVTDSEPYILVSGCPDNVLGRDVCVRLARP